MKRRVGTVDICGLPFAVYLADETGCPDLADAYGLCRPSHQEIYLEAGMSRALREYYLVHEILHAVWAHTGTGDLVRGSTVEGLEENVVRAWTPALARALVSARGVRL